MQCQKLSEDIHVKVSPKRLWSACIKDGHNSAVKSVPEKIAKFDHEHESFVKVGGVRAVYFHKGVHPFDFLKGMVEEVDEEKLYLKMHVIDGSLGATTCNSYTVTLQFLQGVVKCTVECGGPRERHFLEDVREFFCNVVKKIDEFALANENEYKCE